ncbi:TORTIFOLIA1-like protein 2, partial [Phalaenopsis equestris]|uniref:TORTIFOLIA1-like protein 2 n=1 Tax=Phalaenopsis equestris TaxID=78828 RepID=UPI0009E1F942
MRTQRMRVKAKGTGRMVNPQQAIYELKHKLVMSLNKLADRDTYQIGAEELEKIAEGLTPEGIIPFLSCIIDIDSEQKSAVRKECIKVLGTLARFHGNLMSAHIGKMVSSIIKRLKDSDSAVRDACVETAGVLTMTAESSGGGENGFVALVKPFFEALGEQNRYVQTGSALCLTKVIDEAREPPIALLAQMLTRVVKLLKNQHFMAKPAVIELIRSIVQAGGASAETSLQLAVTSIAEALKCTDWTTRKAASLALAEIAGSAGSALGYLKTSCICSLESCRFDKVKPVRDAVVHALQCWKFIPGTDHCDPSEAGSSTK